MSRFLSSPVISSFTADGGAVINGTPDGVFTNPSGDELAAFARHGITMTLLPDASSAVLAAGVNHVRAAGVVTLGTPSLSAQGADTNIGVALAAKGTGTVRLQTRGATAFEVNATGTPGNFIRVNAGASGATPTITAQGSDTNVALQFVAKGAAPVSTFNPLQIPGYTVATLPAAATYPRCMIYVSDGTANKRLAISDGTNWRWPDGAVVS